MASSGAGRPHVCPHAAAVAAWPTLVEEPRADRALDRSQLGLDFQRLVGAAVDVDDDIAELAVGLQILGADIQAAPGKYLDDMDQHARRVAVDVDEAGAGGRAGSWT